MKLIITEKPSQAAAICAALGVKEEKKHDGYIEGNGIIATWCLGHLVEMSPPESYSDQYRRWSYDTLPIIPKDWKYQIKQTTRKQFNTVKGLLLRQDTEPVCATDAGREGELIFRLVYNESHCSKPYSRLWISSMEEAAIRYGMEHLQPGSSYDNLYEAALCRAKADWLIGMAEATSKESVTIKTELQFECAGSIFRTSYDEPKTKGFRAYTEQFKKDHGIARPEKVQPHKHFNEGDIIAHYDWKGSIKEDATKPAQHYTESTLLNAMEKAGANETSKDAERKGLGTPATRADIIEKLIHDGYVKRTGKKLEATDEGMKLITIIPDRLKSPSYTAEWENRLAEIAKGETSPHVFMECIETEVRQMVQQYRNYKD